MDFPFIGSPHCVRLNGGFVLADHWHSITLWICTMAYTRALVSWVKVAAAEKLYKGEVQLYIPYIYIYIVLFFKRKTRPYSSSLAEERFKNQMPTTSSLHMTAKQFTALLFCHLTSVESQHTDANGCWAILWCNWPTTSCYLNVCKKPASTASSVASLHCQPARKTNLSINWVKQACVDFIPSELNRKVQMSILNGSCKYAFNPRRKGYFSVKRKDLSYCSQISSFVAYFWFGKLNTRRRWGKSLLCRQWKQCHGVKKYPDFTECCYRNHR